MIRQQGEPQVPEVVVAFRPSGGCEDGTNGGKHDADQNADNGDYDQQFDQGKSLA